MRFKRKRKKPTYNRKTNKSNVLRFIRRNERVSKTTAVRKPGIWGPNFKTVRNFLTVFQDQTVRISKTEIENVAIKLANSVKNAIYRQRYQWPPLSAKYAAWKAMKGLDPRMLIATGTYVRSIKAIPRFYLGKVATWAVGPPNGIHEPSGLPYRKLARIHEFGSELRNIPPRPVWIPTWRKFLEQDKRGVIREIHKKVIRTSKKTNYTVTVRTEKK